ncbi:MAG: hypothetical protein B6D37_14540 [Sphingobacteriales bacterium UTBCD1]|jgi:hypothetical protein|nr:MAG: hypothetical protein B6D37_14540 [Sphingobacteriales bacterium UTBCD1]
MANTTGKKFGGRAKGTPNKLTTVQRQYIQSVLDMQTDRFKTELSNLTGSEYVKAILYLMEFVIPKLSRTEISDITPPKEITYFKLPDGTLVKI